jgi:HAE1 family hydrophobic/amphiphilic exporter-1
MEPPMNLADISIRRPIFMTCLVLLSLIAGLMAMSRLGVDLFPDVTFPVVTVTIPYPGAGPSEVESLIAKPVEDELSTLAGIKRLSSDNQEGVAVIIAEFTLETDVKYAEQQVRDHIGSVRNKLPNDVKEPVIRRIDPADQPVLQLAIRADLQPAQLYDLADDKIKPRLGQVNQVGLVEINGGRKREIQVQLDRKKLKDSDLSASSVAARLAGTGEDIPSGKKSKGDIETTFRTVGQFKSLDDIRDLIVNFFGNETPIRIGDVGQVVDTLEDEKSRAFLNGEKSLFVDAYRQSGANTIAVVDALKAKVAQMNEEFKTAPGHPQITIVRDGSDWIRANILDVKESIYLGSLLAVLVVFFFLANLRSTIITGLALPNSLVGAFILMAIAGFTINVMSLLALSLAVGLLIDDAIVVRENIFRHIEMGEKPIDAALKGTAEVRMAVIATTLTVIAVFGPLGFLTGVVGQFFKQFGLTVCFAMAISLFDALTVAPMLSAYFAGSSHPGANIFPDFNGIKNILLFPFRFLGWLWTFLTEPVLSRFVRFQDWLEEKYESLLHFTLRWPLSILGGSFLIFLGSLFLVSHVTKTFLPAQDAGEFSVSMDLPPGTNIEKTSEIALEADKIIRQNKEVAVAATTVGSQDGDPNAISTYVHLVKSKERKLNTGEVKEKIRQQLKPFAYANPAVKDYDPVGAGQRPFNLNITGTDQKELEEFSLKVAARLKKNPGLKDVDVNFRPGKPEFQVRPDKERAEKLGTSTAMIGNELRTQIEGVTPAKFRENQLEYDIRVRLQDDQRNLKDGFAKTYVPNLNGSLIRLQDVSTPFDTEGPSKITRQDRIRYIQINADITPGAGLGDVMNESEAMLSSDLKPPAGISYIFVGQAENFKELGASMTFAMGAGILFIFLVLASLYESFVTPFTIMLALPLAICGSITALFLSHQSLDIFSMIGIIMLLGVATKNSILLVDYAQQMTNQGIDRTTAIVRAGKTRLRPILMTTMALIAGSLPIALGLNEASKQRTSMGMAIIGGLVSSTILTLVVVPAAYSYIDRFRVWSQEIMKRIFMSAEMQAELKREKSQAKVESAPVSDHLIVSK